MKNPVNDVVKRLRSITEREYRIGYANGYQAALDDLDNTLAELAEISHAQDEQPFVEGVRASEQGIGGKLSPRLNDAWTWLLNHPGSTQQEAYNCRAVSNKAVFYKLVNRGFARKEGAQFFAIEDSAP